MIMRFDFNGRWNWIDDKNTVIGYDNYSQCCESFTYYYTSDGVPREEVPTSTEGPDPDLSEYTISFQR